MPSSTSAGLSSSPLLNARTYPSPLRISNSTAIATERVRTVDLESIDSIRRRRMRTSLRQREIRVEVPPSPHLRRADELRLALLKTQGLQKRARAPANTGDGWSGLGVEVADWCAKRRRRVGPCSAKARRSTRVHPYGRSGSKRPSRRFQERTSRQARPSARGSRRRRS